MVGRCADSGTMTSRPSTSKRAPESSVPLTSRFRTIPSRARIPGATLPQAFGAASSAPSEGTRLCWTNSRAGRGEPRFASSRPGGRIHWFRGGRRMATTGDGIGTSHSRTLTSVLPDSKILSRFLESAPDAIVVVDARGRIVMLNGRAERLFGYARGDLVGQPIDGLVPERSRVEHASLRHGYEEDPRVRPMGAGLELYGLRKDGAEFPVEISLSPIRTAEGVMTIAAIRALTVPKRPVDPFRNLLETKEIERILERKHVTFVWQALVRVLGTGAAALLYRAGYDAGGAALALIREMWAPQTDVAFFAAIRDYVEAVGLGKIVHHEINR